MASAKTISLLARNDLILVHAVKLKPAITVQLSGRMSSSGISDVVTASVYSEKTRMKKLMMKMTIIIIIIIIGRAKRAPHWGVQSRFRVIYVYMYICVSVVVQKA